MTVLRRLDRFLLSSAFGKTLLGLVVTTGAAVLLGLPADPQPSPLLVGRITPVVLVVCGTWYGVRRSALERAASADVAAAATARAYLALFEREGLTADLGQASDGLSNEDLLQ